MVDASVLIALLDERDEHHADAIDVFTMSPRFVVHPLTLAEVLVHPVRLGQESEVVARLTAIGMSIAPHELDAVELARLRAASGLKMPDCIVVATARSLGTTIVTFDRRLAQTANQAPDFDA